MLGLLIGLSCIIVLNEETEKYHEEIELSFQLKLFLQEDFPLYRGANVRNEENVKLIYFWA